jgi:hypothetical protein
LIRPTIIALAIASMLAAPTQAMSPIAEVLCAPTTELTRKLERQFGAERRATGLRGPEQVMEVWRADHGDWTLVVRYATGTSCIVAMGEHWMEEAEDDAG